MFIVKFIVVNIYLKTQCGITKRKINKESLKYKHILFKININTYLFIIKHTMSRDYKIM